MTSKILKIVSLIMVIISVDLRITQAQMAVGFVNDASNDNSDKDDDKITTILAQRYRGLRSSGNIGGEEIYIGTGDLGKITDRVKSDFSYQPTLEFTISYDATNNIFTNQTKIIAGNGSSSTLNSSVSNLKSFVGSSKAAIINRMNYMQMEISLNNNKNDNGQVTVENLSLNGQSINGTYTVSGKNTVYYNIMDVEFAAGFTLTGRIRLTGNSFNNSAEANRLDFTWGYNGGFTILPLKLTNISGLAENSRQNKISWTTLENNEGQYFEIERSANGKDFTTIEKIAVKSFAATEQYTFYDNKPLATAFYRIKATDINNRTSYSEIIKISQKTGAIRMLQQTNQTQLIFPDSKERIIAVYTMSGQMVKKAAVTSNQFVISHNSLKDGMYVLHVSGDGKTETKQMMAL